MNRVGIRELNQHASRVVDRVRNGETIEVTDHGRPVARIVPIDDAVGLLGRLVQSGAAVPPILRGRIPMPERTGDPAISLADEISRDRNHETL